MNEGVSETKFNKLADDEEKTLKKCDDPRKEIENDLNISRDSNDLS